MYVSSTHKIELNWDVCDSYANIVHIALIRERCLAYVCKWMENSGMQFAMVAK